MVNETRKRTFDSKTKTIAASKESVEPIELKVTQCHVFEKGDRLIGWIQNGCAVLVTSYDEGYSAIAWKGDKAMYIAEFDKEFKFLWDKVSTNGKLINDSQQ